jgi:phage terminase large subunit
MNLPAIELPEYAKDLWQPFRHLAWYGGRGGAKSRTVATGLVLQSMERHERVLCGRETQRSIKDSSKRLIDDEIDRLGFAPPSRAPRPRSAAPTRACSSSTACAAMRAA